MLQQECRVDRVCEECGSRSWMLAEMGQVRDMRARDAGKRGKCEVRRDARSERMECGVAAGWRELVVEG